MCFMCSNVQTHRRGFLTTCIAGSAAAAFLAEPVAAQTASPGKVDEATVQKMMTGWPETATKAAKDVIAQYGQPHEATSSMLVWHNSGPWKLTTVYKEEIDHDFPMPHKDVLEQWIDYKVPTGKFDELARYDGSVIVERTRGTMSARCDKEGANFLAINLANDVVQGKKSVDEARKFYAETIQAFMKKGEKHAYMQELQFKVASGPQGDKDKAVMAQ